TPPPTSRPLLLPAPALSRRNAPAARRAKGFHRPHARSPRPSPGPRIALDPPARERSGEPDQGRAARAGFRAREIQLGPLSPDQARRIVLEQVGQALSAAQGTVEAIVREAGGSPLLVEQLARYAATAPVPEGVGGAKLAGGS